MTEPTDSLIAAWREQFPALRRTLAGRPVAYFDGPAGSQAPRCVIEAVSEYLARTNANHGGLFATSRESDALLDEAHRAAADLLGVDDPACVVFGQNMTSLTFAVSRSLARTWAPGDEVVVTRLDHDANVTPWVLAARDAGAIVRHVPLSAEDQTLDLDALRSLLGPRTRLVAVGAASNALGTVNPIERIVPWAHAVGALVYVDAVHYAPHRLPDAGRWGCDFLACSAYKFCGPHVGLVWGRRALWESLEPYKVRPAPESLPGRWMTGTQSHEGIAGVRAAIDYLASLAGGAPPNAASEASNAGETRSPRRAALTAAYDLIRRHEDRLARRLVEGLAALGSLRVYGLTNPARLSDRVPTVSFAHRRLTAREVAGRLAEAGLFAWHGNFYALALTEALGLEPEGLVRVGCLHYNTREEVERLLDALARLD